MAHTLAPWIMDNGTVLIEDQCDIILQNIQTKKEWTCIGQPDTESDGLQNVIALCHPDNAQLIASAPQLLEALKFAHALLIENESNWYTQGHDRKIKAAISKAEGKE